MKTKKPVPSEVSAYMRKLGQRAAAINRQKGSAYFKHIRSFGKQKKEKTNE